MILKVAWRNVWRNRGRSLVVICAIAIGLWAGIFASAFVVGMMEQRIDSVIRTELSHLQVHHPEFRDEFLPEHTIPDHEDLLAAIEESDSIKAYSDRVIAMVMLGSAHKNGGLKLTGIDPEMESRVTDIHERLEEGAYFEGMKRNPILISEKTAEDYRVTLRSKVVVTVQDVEGEITAGAFRIVGIYDTNNDMYDDMNAFVLKEDLQELIGVGNQIHEVAVLGKGHAMAENLTDNLQSSFKDGEVLSWMDLSPGMRMILEAKDTYTVFIVSIILIALLFSIVNTMLMAVLERTREIGILMAVGMSKMKVFAMIMYETLFLTLIGGPVGLFLSWLTIFYFGTYGIDLGNASYEEMGFSNVVYPSLEAESYVRVSLMVASMAIIAAVYPARKALKLIPVEAIRKI